MIFASCKIRAVGEAAEACSVHSATFISESPQRMGSPLVKSLFFRMHGSVSISRSVADLIRDATSGADVRRGGPTACGAATTHLATTQQPQEHIPNLPCKDGRVTRNAPSGLVVDVVSGLGMLFVIYKRQEGTLCVRNGIAIDSDRYLFGMCACDRNKPARRCGTERHCKRQ